MKIFRRLQKHFMSKCFWVKMREKIEREISLKMRKQFSKVEEIEKLFVKALVSI